jgi:hypothetical protein
MEGGFLCNPRQVNCCHPCLVNCLGLQLAHCRHQLLLLPLLVPAAVTDSRHYMKLSANGALRFTPYTTRKADFDYNRIHGVNERVRISDFACALNTYKDVLRGFGLLGPQSSKRAETSGRAGSSSAEGADRSDAQTEL